MSPGAWISSRILRAGLALAPVFAYAQAVATASHRVIELPGKVVDRREAPKAAPASVAVWRVTATSLYVRNAPHFAGVVVDVLQKGARVEGRAVPIGWVELEPGRYISAQHLEPAPSAP